MTVYSAGTATSRRKSHNLSEEDDASISITSNDGKLNSASAVLEVSATNAEYNQPVLRIKQAGKRGGAASIRIDDPNPDIEFVETGLTGPDPGAGKYEIAVQADKLQINGRNADDTAFETMVVFQRRAVGGNIGIRTASQFGAGRGGHRDCQCYCCTSSESRWRRDYVRRGRSAQVSGVEWHGNGYCTSIDRNLQQGGTRQ